LIEKSKINSKWLDSPKTTSSVKKKLLKDNLEWKLLFDYQSIPCGKMNFRRGQFVALAKDLRVKLIKLTLALNN